MRKKKVANKCFKTAKHMLLRQLFDGAVLSFLRQLSNDVMMGIQHDPGWTQSQKTLDGRTPS